MTQIISRPFGTTSGGNKITRYIMKNSSGVQISIISYGAAVQSIKVFDKYGVQRDVALGYDAADFYEAGSCCFGAFIGRYANRIKDARFTLNGKTVYLSKNEGNNHLHGSFHRYAYDAETENGAVVFHFKSLPSDEGFPGTLEGEVLYRLTDDNALEIEYTAKADEDTVINLTNHTYFNLNGQNGSQILDHILKMNCDRFLEFGEDNLPTGRVLKVENTPFDFRSKKMIGKDIFSSHHQLELVSGYDHNMIINGPEHTLREAAIVKSEKTGIILTVLTTEPAVQFYTGNVMDTDAAPHGKSGIKYPKYGGLCIEAQHYPNSPNIPSFPSTVLKKGEIYTQKTVYRFSVE